MVCALNVGTKPKLKQYILVVLHVLRYIITIIRGFYKKVKIKGGFSPKFILLMVAWLLVISSCNNPWMAGILGINQDNVNSYTVAFNSDGGSLVESQTIIEGYMASKPDAPIRSGYVFANWYSDKELTTVFNFSTPIIADRTLYAKWLRLFTVSFDADGGTPVPEQETVAEGRKVSSPPAMTKAGYSFNGWYNDEAFNDLWIFETDTVKEDLTLYAKWTEVPPGSYNVTFESNGGNSPSDQIVAAGGKASWPPDVTRDGYTLSGWYKEEAFINVWDFDTDIVISDMKLYAKWTRHIYTVTYMDGDTELTALTQRDVAHGNTVTRPTNPIKPGFIFVNWCSDSELSTLYNFDVPITDNKILYAQWNRITYIVKFESNGGNEVLPRTVNEGETAARPDNPTKGGNNFDNWYSDMALAIPYDFAAPVTSSITLYAEWIPPFADINAIAAYLASQPGGGTPDNPVVLYIGLDLENTTQAGSGWRQLLQAIEDAGKYVDLDLSASVMDETEWYFDGPLVPKFDPDYTISTGKDKIVSIALPDTATQIVDGNPSLTGVAFEYFYNLKSFSGAGLTTIGNFAFYNISSLAMSSLPAGITYIGDSTFSGCTGLTLTELPAGVTLLGSNAFYGCTGLTRITLHEYVGTMATDTFNGCTNLALVTCLGATPPGVEYNGSNMFDNTAPNLSIRVPAANVDTYKAASRWSYYANIISGF
jgi:uncharacterized repeat protein (TIGR02543 family)